MKSSIPLCFYPSRKIMIDDDQTFSQSILLKMHGKNFSTFNSPQAALEYLLQEYKPMLARSDLFKTYIDSEDSLSSYAPLSSIDNLFKKDMAFLKNEIDVLLVDYHMPEMSGVNFLEKIADLPIKKALITGEQDYTIAISAFNDGLVDAYIRKDDPDFTNKIQHIVSTLEWKYFTDLSVAAYDISDLKYLTNESFAKTFKNFISEKNIVSFLLSDKKGDFTAYDSQGTKNIFILRSKTQLKELATLAAEDGASDETIRNLMTAKTIPFFGDKKHWEVPATKWHNFLHPATALAGDENFSWVALPCSHPVIQE